MDTNIFRKLLAQRLGTEPKKFEMDGDQVKWFDPEKNNRPVTEPEQSPYDTPENRAIVTDAIENYETLAAAYLAEQEAIAISNQAKTDLIDIDTNSVRSIREWLVTQPDAPQYLVDYEADAIETRKKVK